MSGSSVCTALRMRKVQYLMLATTPFYTFPQVPQNVLITRFVLLVRSGTDLTALHAKTGRWFFWNDAGRVLGR